MKNQLKSDPGGKNLLSQIVKYRLAEFKTSSNYLPSIVLLVAAVFFVEDLYIDVVVEGKKLSHILLEGVFFWR